MKIGLALEELHRSEGESALAERIREKGAELPGRRSHAALLLLRDLREIYMKAAGVSADWEMIAQAARGIKHTDLLEVSTRCHPDTLHQMRWANSKLKEESTQILISQPLPQPASPLASGDGLPPRCPEPERGGPRAPRVPRKPPVSGRTAHLQWLTKTVTGGTLITWKRTTPPEASRPGCTGGSRAPSSPT
jgi:hypothetical protein